MEVDKTHSALVLEADHTDVTGAAKTCEHDRKMSVVKDHIALNNIGADS